MNVDMQLAVPQGTLTREGHPPQLQGDALATDGNLDKIRELLFGAQMRDAERRLSHLEERLRQAHEDLKADVRRRVESLEVFLRQELESLTDRIHVECNARDDASRAFAQELKELVTTIEHRTWHLGGQAVRAQRELRQYILDQSKTLRDECAGPYHQLSDVIGRAIHDLRREKTDRIALAALFSELALRLSHE